MNEQALNDAYELFSSKGYTKSIEEFKVLMASNENALNDAYKLFSSKGYSKPIDDFKVLIGVSDVKKKVDSEPVTETKDTMVSTGKESPESLSSSDSQPSRAFDIGVESINELDQRGKIPQSPGPMKDGYVTPPMEEEQPSGPSTFDPEKFTAQEEPLIEDAIPGLEQGTKKFAEDVASNVDKRAEEAISKGFIGSDRSNELDEVFPNLYEDVFTQIQNDKLFITKYNGLSDEIKKAIEPGVIKENGEVIGLDYTKIPKEAISKIVSDYDDEDWFENILDKSVESLSGKILDQKKVEMNLQKKEATILFEKLKNEKDALDTLEADGSPESKREVELAKLEYNNTLARLKGIEKDFNEESIVMNSLELIQNNTKIPGLVGTAFTAAGTAAAYAFSLLPAMHSQSEGAKFKDSIAISRWKEENPLVFPEGVDPTSKEGVRLRIEHHQEAIRGADLYSEKVMKKSLDIFNSIKDFAPKDYRDSNFNFAGEVAGQVAFQVAMSRLGGASTIPLGMNVASFEGGYSMSRMEMYADAIDGGLDHVDAARLADQYALISAPLEMIPLGGYLGKKAEKIGMAQFRKKIVSEISEKGVKNFSKDFASNQIAFSLKPLFINAGVEFLEEGGQEAAQYNLGLGLSKLYNDKRGEGQAEFKKEDFGSDEYWKNMRDNFALGGLAGAGIGGTMSILNGDVYVGSNYAAMEEMFLDPKQMDKVNAQLESYRKTGKIETDEDLQVAKERVGIISKAAAEVDNATKTTPALSNDKTKRKLFELTAERLSLNKEVEGVETLALVSDKKDRIAKIDETISGIVSGQITLKDLANEEQAQETETPDNTTSPATDEAGESIDVVGEEVREGAGDTETEQTTGEVTAEVEATSNTETVNEVMERSVTLFEHQGSALDEPIVGDLVLDGQRVVVETQDGKIYDIGNREEIGEQGISELGMSYDSPKVVVTEEGKLNVGEDSYTIQEDLPTQGVEYDEAGDVLSVSVLDGSGKPTMFKGALAEDMALQVLLNQTQTEEQKSRIDKLLEQDEEFNNEIRAIEEAPKKETDKDTEQVAEQEVKDDSSTATEPKKRLISDDAYKKAQEEINALRGNLNSLSGKGAKALSIVIARKIEDGVIGLSKMTEEIVKMFGEEFRPYVENAYNAAEAKIKKSKKRKTKTQRDVDNTISSKRNKVTLDEIVGLKEQIKVLDRGAKTAKKSIESTTKKLADEVNELVKKGKISANQMTNVMSKFSKVDMFNEDKISEFADYMSKVFDDADYGNKLSEAKSLVAKIKKQSKKGEITISKAGKAFAEINPSLVDDIDLFLDQAASVLEGLRSTTKTDLAKGKTRGTFNIKKINEYVASTIESQNKKIYEKKKKSFQNTTGIDPSQLSLEEMSDLLNKLKGKDLTKEQKEKESKDKSEAIEKAAKNSFEGFKKSVLLGIKNGSIKVDKATKKMIGEFVNIDLDLLSTEEKIMVIDAIINFKSNPEATGGMGTLLAEYRGNKGMFDLFKSKITSKLRSTLPGSEWASNISTLPMAIEYIFKSQSKALKVMKNIGLDGVVNGSAKAETESNRLMDTYAKKFKKKKMQKGIYFDDVNETERGVLAFIRRTVPGTAEEQKQEFERRKGLIEETYTELIKSTDAIKKKTGELIKDSYDKLIVGSENYTDVDGKADPVNLEGVKDISKIWKDLHEDLSSVALDYYNIDLGQDLNYTPDNFVLNDNPDIEINDIDQPMFNPDERDPSLRDEETGVLKENKRVSKLPKGRILSLGFDTQNYRNLKDAMTDINTAPSIRQMKGAMNSKYFERVFVNDSFRRIVKERMYKYVELKRGKTYETENNRKILNALSKITALGVRQVLGGITQPLKQVIPIANTVINAGVSNTAAASKLMLDKDVRDAVNNSGLPIANRGASSQADMKSINLRIKNTTDNIALKAIDKIDQFNRYIIDKTLVYTDVGVAKTSFVAYYIKAMEDKGVKASEIDWKQPLNEEAGAYAMQQVNRQQNVSDSDLQGNLFTNKKVGTQVARKTLFTFANFLLNQKTRMYSDINTLYRNPTASKEDKTAALKSLGGLGVETIAFNAMGFAINQILTSLYYALRGEDESEDEKEKRIKNQVRGKVGNVIADIFSPIPLLNDVVLGGVNNILEMMADPEDKDPFKVFSKDEKSFLERMGALGIGAQKALNLYEMAKISATGKVENEYMGKKTVKEISDEDRDIMKNVSMTYFLYVTGSLPFSEVGYMSEKALREVKRSKKSRSSSVKVGRTEAQEKKALKETDPVLYRQIYGK